MLEIWGLGNCCYGNDEASFEILFSCHISAGGHSRESQVMSVDA